MKTLRRAGNQETVTAVVSGLYASERRSLAAIPGVEVAIAPGNGHPTRQRLRDFADVIAGWPDDTPVAYWDAGDILFQDRLGPLWEQPRAHPDRLLAARECFTGADNTVARYWVESIHDPASRARALEFLMTRPILNSGFAAGSVRTMQHDMRGADALLRSTDWGDQTAMNLFCHTNLDAWPEVSLTCIYCLMCRPDSEYRVTIEGRTERIDGELVRVAHGAGGALRRWDLLHLTA